MILPTCFRKGSLAVPGSNTILKTLVDGSTEEVKKVIGESKFSSSLAQLQRLDFSKERRRSVNRKIVISLAVGQAKAFAKLKKLARRETAQQIIDDFSHTPDSCMGKLKDATEDLTDSMKEKYDAMSCTCSTGKGCCGRCQYKWQCCKPGPKPTTDGLGSRLYRLLKITVAYIDVVRDTILVSILIKITGYDGFFSDDATLFPNVVILILGATVAVPTFVSAIQTSARHPLTIFEFTVWNNYRTKTSGKWELVFIRFLVFSLYCFMPAILINNKEKAKLRRQILEEQGKEEYDSKDGMVTNGTLEEQEQIEAYLDEVRKAHLIFEKTEAALELVAQQSIQLMMLLLSLTKYPVVTGL